MDFELYDKYMHGEYDPADYEMRKKARAWKDRQEKRVKMAKEFQQVREMYENKKL